jgi:glutamate-5-semialdehyde dehydrogenase
MTNTLETTIVQQAQQAKQGAKYLAHLPTAVKDNILQHMAKALREQQTLILAANTQDLAKAQQSGLSTALCDRLKLTPARIEGMATGLEEIAQLPDPVEKELACDELTNGLMIHKISVPLGVLGFIYEARPNVTTDAIGLAIKSGNGIILKGGKEAIESNRAIMRCVLNAFQQVVDNANIVNAVQFIDSTEREATYILLAQKDYIDLVIPRGGKSLIQAIAEHTDIPVLKHLDGICHIFIDDTAQIEMANNIVLNAKCQRPSACNALETLLVHAQIAPKVLPIIIPALIDAGVELRGCKRTLALVNNFPISAAIEDDWRTEYLDMILSIKIVDALEEAITHINTYGSHHSDSIITETAKHAADFLQQIDSAVVYHNASTRFTDGSVFGMGAEMGISTGKLHARGPVGLMELTTYQYRVFGHGQIRD